jgi:hypothetical protein
MEDSESADVEGRAESGGKYRDTEAGRQASRLTRPVVAELLQVSVATVRRLEGTLLHPHRGEDGVYLFEPSEVENAARKRPHLTRHKETNPGEVAAAAFTLFKKGVRPSDVVIELERCPEEVSHLHSQWERLNDRLVLSEKTVETLSRMAAARVIDYDLFNLLLSDDAEELSALLKEKLEERVARRRAVRMDNGDLR